MSGPRSWGRKIRTKAKKVFHKTSAKKPGKTQDVNYMTEDDPTRPTDHKACGISKQNDPSGNPTSISDTDREDRKSSLLSAVKAGPQKDALRQFLGVPASPCRLKSSGARSTRDNSTVPRLLPSLAAAKLIHHAKRNKAVKMGVHGNDDSQRDIPELQPSEIGPARFTYHYPFAETSVNNPADCGDKTKNT
ncbi:uncharacterized protein BKA78DRAFT_357054 [Phyllosticta capitalensis]|uniref:uncharacterized protein n=1 Tax=Phyllosticta capitalensis TaxID=121624 RepID=UPI00313145C1